MTRERERKPVSRFVSAEFEMDAGRDGGEQAVIVYGILRAVGFRFPCFAGELWGFVWTPRISRIA